VLALSLLFLCTFGLVPTESQHLALKYRFPTQEFQKENSAFQPPTPITN
jgi:hypothetical protein